MFRWRALAVWFQDLYERTCPIGWLQICYPFYYLAQLVLTDAEESGTTTTIRVTPWAVSAICFWILWLQIRHLRPLAKVWQLSRTIFNYSEGRYRAAAPVPENDLNTPLDVGLSRDEVLRRRKIYGWN